MSLLIVMGCVSLVIVAVQAVMPRLVDETVPFGVRIPPDRVADPAVARALVRYRLGIAFDLCVTVAAWLFAWRVNPHQSTLPEVIPLLPIVPIVVGFAVYLWVRRTLRKAKRDGRWLDGYRQVVAADTNMAQYRQPVSAAWAIPSVVLVVASFVVGAYRYAQIPTVFPTHFNAAGVANGFAAKSIGSVFLLVFVQLGTLLLVGALQAAVVRAHGSLDPADVAGSARRQSRKAARLVQAVWLLIALVNVGMLWADLRMWGITHVGAAGMTIGVLIPMLAGVIVVTVAAAQSAPAATGARAALAAAVDRAAAPDGDAVNAPTKAVLARGAQRDRPIRRDDDANWRLGALYFNRDDPRFWVEKRFGIGWTCNFAHPLAWVLAVVVMALIVGALLLPRMFGGR